MAGAIAGPDPAATLRRRLGLTYRGGASAYLFVLPSIVFIGVFVIVPIFAPLFFSFNDYDLLTAPKIAGLKSYELSG
ncbi:MAG: sugar ABC transporter permease [Chloroflexi bacterium]|nr:sugar ABC transporter permease [Chloroflexota bacterium]